MCKNKIKNFLFFYFNIIHNIKIFEQIIRESQRSGCSCGVLYYIRTDDEYDDEYEYEARLAIRGRYSSVTNAKRHLDKVVDDMIPWTQSERIIWGKLLKLIIDWENKEVMFIKRMADKNIRIKGTAGSRYLAYDTKNVVIFTDTIPDDLYDSNSDRKREIGEKWLKTVFPNYDPNN